MRQKGSSATSDYKKLPLETSLRNCNIKIPSGYLLYFANGSYTPISNMGKILFNNNSSDNGAHINILENTIIEKPIVILYLTDFSSEKNTLNPKNHIFIGKK